MATPRRLPRMTPANRCPRSECHVHPVRHRALEMVSFRFKKHGGWRTAGWSSDGTKRHPWTIPIHQPLGDRNVLGYCCSAVDLRSSQFRAQLRVALRTLSVCLWEETGDGSIRSTSQAKELPVGIPGKLQNTNLNAHRHMPGFRIVEGVFYRFPAEPIVGERPVPRSHCEDRGFPLRIRSVLICRCLSLSFLSIAEVYLLISPISQLKSRGCVLPPLMSTATSWTSWRYYHHIIKLISTPCSTPVALSHSKSSSMSASRTCDSRL